MVPKSISGGCSPPSTRKMFLAQRTTAEGGPGPIRGRTRKHLRANSLRRGSRGRHRMTRSSGQTTVPLPFRAVSQDPRDNLSTLAD